MSFQAFDAEFGNFTLRRQSDLLSGNPYFPRGGSFSLQSSGISTRSQVPGYESRRGQSFISNSDPKITDNIIPPQNFLKEREITLPHSLDLPFGVIKKGYISEESNDSIDLDSDLDIEYYMSVPQNEASNDQREQNESSELKPSRHAQVKGYTSGYDSILDSQSVSNYYESLTFERESFDNISTEHSVVTKDTESATKATTQSESHRDTKTKTKLSTLLSFGRNSEEKWDQSTATLKLGFAKIGILYGTKMRDPFREGDNKESKILSTSKKYPLPVSIPQIPVMEISDYDQGNDKVFSVEKEQTRQSRLRLKHASSIQLEGINRELNDNILNCSTKKFNSYTSFMFLKSFDSYENNTGKFEKLNSRGQSLDRVSQKRLKRQDAREIDFRSHGEVKMLLKYETKHIRNKDTEISVSLLQDEDTAVLSKDNAYDWETTMAKVHGGSNYMGETPVTLIL
ncbi:hypothetical protein CHS0354_008418 [Potamilus streckersoni]|uniref:Uncharacterized protein n=1 Tax=Potamilus streckersoni TaxID=2493646 RepID=A0AAE0RPV7_9BIVA|nr:hypothetical protein CHS0354_008418 [Potamilus streckersoni]